MNDNKYKKLFSKIPINEKLNENTYNTIIKKKKTNYPYLKIVASLLIIFTLSITYISQTEPSVTEKESANISKDESTSKEDTNDLEKNIFFDTAKSFSGKELLDTFASSGGIVKISYYSISTDNNGKTVKTLEKETTSTNDIESFKNALTNSEIEELTEDLAIISKEALTLTFNDGTTISAELLNNNLLCFNEKFAYRINNGLYK